MSRVISLCLCLLLSAAAAPAVLAKQQEQKMIPLLRPVAQLAQVEEDPPAPEPQGEQVDPDEERFEEEFDGEPQPAPAPPPPAQPSAPPPPSEPLVVRADLPHTGADSRVMVATAFWMLLAGLTLRRVTGYRRRHAAERW